MGRSRSSFLFLSLSLPFFPSSSNAAAQVSKRHSKQPQPQQQQREQYNNYSILFGPDSLCACVCACFMCIFVCALVRMKLGIVSFSFSLSFRNERKCCLMCFLLFTSAGGHQRRPPLQCWLLNQSPQNRSSSTFFHTLQTQSERGNLGMLFVEQEFSWVI